MLKSVHMSVKMGEILKDFTVFSERLEHFILAYSKKVATGSPDFGSTILRSTRKARGVDFSVAAAVVDRLKIKDSESFSKALLKECAHWPLPIESCAITDQGALGIKLHRSSIFKKVLTTVQREGNSYGRIAAGTRNGPSGIAIVNGHLLRGGKESRNGDGERDEGEVLTLSQLRGLLLTEHLTALLETAGFQVCNLTPVTHASSTVLDLFRIGLLQTLQNEASSSRDPSQATLEKFVRAASSCKFRTNRSASGHQDKVTVGRRSRDSDVEAQASPAEEGLNEGDQRLRAVEMSHHHRDVHLDLHRFITDEELPLGRNGYDKNLQTVGVVSADGKPSPLLRRCCLVEERLGQIQPLPSHLLHISSQGASFQQQQVDLTWRLCTSQAASQSFQQHHLIHGPVVARRADSKDTEHVDALELLRIREAQTREASILKYGEDVKGEGWEQIIQTLTVAGLKFEILGKQCGHMLKVELSDARNSSTWPDSRDGVFVMYNYARLCTLFNHFQEEVAKGTYPTLPCVSTVDFSLLREDQEWGLVFNYVLQYPVMLAECVSDILVGKGPQVTIQTHRICSFLVSLCRDLSSYYSHTHVLGEPRLHLVPTMFARLHLLQGIKQILKNGLSLLNIQPLEQM